MTATNSNNPGGKRPKKRNSDKVDLRLLIAAASITATVGGVGWIAAADPTSALSSQAVTPATQGQAPDASAQQAPQAPQAAEATPTTVPDAAAPITAPDPATVAPAPTATPEPILPQVTIPQRQWPVPMGRSRSSR